MVSIRPAKAGDAPLLAAMIRELAEYEHLSQEVILTEEDLLRDGFGRSPKFRAVIAECDGQMAGYAVFFEFYSTFQGRAGLFLEDIFVRPEFRRQNIGKALLAHVAGIARKEGYVRMRWEVLDWNTVAIDFYKKLGAAFMDEWKPVCLSGDALEAAAKEAETGN
ncbi:MAG: GNAT family N-acetyltransferase [Candidatus Acidiferrales bacterium]